MKKSIVLLLSGGLDSTAALYWYKKQHPQVDIHTLAFSYGQRNASELVAAAAISEFAMCKSHVNLNIDSRLLGPSALTDHDASFEATAETPASFVPGRNLIFLSAAGSYAAKLGAEAVVVGSCKDDVMPDSSKEFLALFKLAMQVGFDRKVDLVYPLINLSKADTIEMMWHLGEKAWTALGLTVTCYNGKHPGCGACPACETRAEGFKRAVYNDPQLTSKGPFKWLQMNR